MQKLRGVNLGGWLVLEKWITPSLFKGSLAQDQISLIRQLGDEARTRILNHYETFITQADISWLAAHAINAVRVPIPHWFNYDDNFHVNCERHIGRVLEWANISGLKVILDIHTAPGSQNGQDHSGEAGKTRWHMATENIERSLHSLELLSQKFGKYPALIGIEILNEPGSSIPKNVLVDFNRRAYEIIRSHASEDIAVIASDGYHPKALQQAFSNYQNAWMDTHLYQCFTFLDKRMPIHRNIKKAKYDWADLVAQKQNILPLIVGEWSLTLDARAFRGMDSFERDKAIQAYGAAQLQAFEVAQGWFYWTYKTEHGGTWSLRESIERGWLRFN